MVGLTLLKPWEAACAFLGKDVENRKWHPGEHVRGQRIALHAGKGWDDAGARFIMEISPAAERGRWAARVLASKDITSGIIATVRIDDWFKLGELHPRAKSKWFFGPWGWQLEDLFVLPEPVPCKGALGLWRLPDDVEVKVLEQEARRAA